MRILYVVHQYPPEFLGGTELYTQTIARAMHLRGHETAVFTRANDDPQGIRSEIDGGVTIFRSSIGTIDPSRRFMLSFGNATLRQHFIQSIDQFQPQQIHIQHLMGLPLDLLDLILERKIPFLITLWDYWWICANAQLLTNYNETICHGPRVYWNCTRCAIARTGSASSWIAAPIMLPLLARRNQLLQRWLQNAAQIIAPTPFVRDWHLQHGLSATKLQVLPPGVDSLGTSKVSVQVKPDHPLRFLFVGGIAKQKGIHIIIQAFQKLRGDVELWIAGDLSAFPEYARQLQSLAGKNVRFLGRVDHSQLGDVFAQSDLTLIPSLWYETFCFVAYESFSAGNPVIASDIGVLPDAVQHDVNGYLVATGDIDAWSIALQQVIDTPSLIQKWRKAIQPPLTVTEHISQLATLYQN